MQGFSAEVEILVVQIEGLELSIRSGTVPM